MNIQAIRELAEQFTANELEACIDDQLGCHKNSCCQGNRDEEIIDNLSKASYIRALMDRENLSFNEALRRLAGIIRGLNLT